MAQRDHRTNVHRTPCGNPRSAESYGNELSNLEHHKGRCRNHALASDLFLSVLISYGTIAATYKHVPGSVSYFAACDD